MRFQWPIKSITCLESVSDLGTNPSLSAIVFSFRYFKGNPAGANFLSPSLSSDHIFNNLAIALTRSQSMQIWRITYGSCVKDSPRPSFSGCGTQL
jgi:hypothetical protein